MTKKILYTLLFCISILFTSCWIYPDYKNYEVVDNTYYFEDYETMKAVIIPLINTSFKDWHWNGEEFDEKYQKYFGNINVNADDYKFLTESDYNYAVRHLTSLSEKIGGATSDVKISECYWISTEDNHGVVFYQN